MVGPKDAKLSPLELRKARRLKRAVDERDAKQKDLAEAIGTSQPTLSRMLKGERKMKEEHTRRLAELLGVPLAELGLAPLREAAPLEPYEIEARTPNPSGAGQRWRDFARQHTQFAAAATLALELDPRVTDAVLDVAARSLGERSDGTYTDDEIESAIVDAVRQRSRIDAILKSARVMTAEDLSLKPKRR